MYTDLKDALVVLVQTTMRVSHEHFERYEGIDNENSLHKATKIDSGVSVGVGAMDTSATSKSAADAG